MAENGHPTTETPHDDGHACCSLYSAQLFKSTVCSDGDGVDVANNQLQKIPFEGEFE